MNPINRTDYFYIDYKPFLAKSITLFLVENSEVTYTCNLDMESETSLSDYLINACYGANVYDIFVCEHGVPIAEEISNKVKEKEISKYNYSKIKIQGV